MGQSEEGDAILVAYATKYGSTKKVAEAVATALRESGLTVDLLPMREVRALEGYGAVVLGAALYMFRWHKDARRFLSHHRKALALRPAAVFGLGPVHEPHDEQEWQNSQAQLDKELAKFPWFEPVSVELFGGVFDPAKLAFPINKFAGSEPPSDIRDWDAIRAWARGLAATLGTAPASGWDGGKPAAINWGCARNPPDSSQIQRS